MNLIIALLMFLVLACGNGEKPAQTPPAEPEEMTEDNFDDDDEELCEDQQADVQTKAIADRYKKGG